MAPDAGLFCRQGGFRRFFGRLLSGAVFTVVFWAAAEAILPAAQPAVRPDVEQAEAVDLFQAMASGRIEARIIPRNSQQCQLLVRNNTDRPLSVALPAAFGAVPVLAQQMAVPMPAEQSPQPLGVVLDRGQPLLHWPGEVNEAAAPVLALWNIAPEKVGRMKLRSVCLALGQPDPKPRIPYEIRRLEDVTTDPVLRQVLLLMGAGRLSQDAAQLAAWHLENGLNWNQLAALCRPGALGLAPRFTPGELAAAREAVEAIRRTHGGQSLGRREAAMR